MTAMKMKKCPARRPFGVHPLGCLNESRHPKGWTPNGGARRVVRRHIWFSGWLSLCVSILCFLAPVARASTPPPGTGGLYFDGINDYVTFGAAPGLGASNFTIEVWFMPLGNGVAGNTGTGGITAVPLVTKGRGENDNTITNCNYFLGIRGSDRVLAADFEDTTDGDNHPVAGTTPVQSNVWQHAAVTYDGIRWVIYFNGRSNGTATTGSTIPRFDSVQHAALGTALNSSGTPQGFFDGVLDEVRIWNVVRTPAQISNNFQLRITNAAGLIGRWSLDETGGTVVTNTGSSGVNGTRVNGPVSAAGYPFDNPPPLNGPPATPTLTAPANNATNVALTTMLGATVSDPNTNALTVTFYGRALVTNAAGPDFTIVTLPDTQYYSSSLNGGLPAMFQAQTDWVVANRVASNIVMVTHMGDIVQNGDNGGNNAEWLVATNAMYRMENPLTTLLADGIPYGVAVGNHDQSPIGNADGSTLFFNQFFGEAHFLGFDYYGGHYGTNNDNNFILFSASGLDFILINLEYDETPAAAVMAWAENLLNTYTNRRAILTSHYLIGTGNPAAFGAQGQIIYDNFRDNRNLGLMLCGHVAGEGRRSDTFDQHTIHTLLADYQGRVNGGDGWLRIMTFSPSNNVIRVQTYSPWLGQYETDANSRFDVPCLMTLPAFAPIATNNVASGNSTSANWSGLAPNTPYEWYTVVSDGSLYATSAVRTFRTGTLPAAGSTPQPGDIIFNEYSADNNANGVDFFELLVLTDNLDLRGLRVTENEITNAATGQLNNGEPVYAFGADNFLANVRAGTVIAIYTGTNGVVTDITLNPLAGDWSLTLAPGIGVTSSADGLGGTPTGGLSTTGDALYLYLPGPDGTSAGTDNVYLDYITWETTGLIAPTGIVDVVFPAPADNGYFIGTTAAQADATNNWVIVDSLSLGAQTPGAVNLGQNLDTLRGLPSVTLTAPVNGSNFTAGATVNFTATANDAGSGSVAKVEFFAGATKLGEDTNAPYQFAWVSPANGVYTLRALATDTDGFTNASGPVSITVGPVAVQLLRGPYLQLSTPDAITIRWRTDIAVNSRVIYGTNLAALNLTNLIAGAVTNHEVRLTNLEPDTRYYYSIGNSSSTLAGPDTNHFFLTHPLPGTPKPLRLWVIGDAGTKDANQQAVRDAFYAYNGTNTVHAWLQLGDNAYNSGTDAEFQLAVFNMYSNILRQSVTWPTLGNHDANNGATAYVDTYPYFSLFTLPTNGAAGGVASGTEHYYSFDLGMAHFICLDSQTAPRGTNDAMAVWLRDDLLANTNRWLIAYWHHPPYSKGSHNSDTETQLVEMRQNFLPILEAGGVDLVLAGHSHCYERSQFINGHYNHSTNFAASNIVQIGSGRLTNGLGAYVKPENFTGTPINNRGAVYITAGSSGQIDGGSLNHPAMFLSLNNLGSLVLDITSNRLNVTFLRELGAVPATNDWFTIIKTNYAPVASNAVVTIPADATANLGFTGNDVNRNVLTFATNNAPTNGLLANFNPVTGAFSFTPARGATNPETLSFIANDGQTNSLPASLTIQITPLVDLDVDGMADAWETANTATNATADLDGDGVNNLQEYWAGTDPNNPLSWLRVTQIDRVGAGYQVVWSSVGGTRYRVSFSNGDVNGDFNGVFTPIARPVAQEMDANAVGTLGTMSFTDNYTLTGGPPPNGRRYYRVQIVR